VESNPFVLQPFTDPATEITTLWLEVKPQGAAPEIKAKSIWFEILFDENGFFFSGWT
jgi:hypothetical protein